jgi:hypothetical protein
VSSAKVASIYRQHIELIVGIHSQLVLSTEIVLRVSSDPEVLDENAIWQREVRVPDAYLAAVHNGCGFLIDERQAILIQKSCYLVLSPRLVGGIAPVIVEQMKRVILSNFDLSSEVIHE